MPARQRGYWILLLLVLLGGFGCYALHPRPQHISFEPAAFTPNSGAIPALRGAAKTANLVICVMDAARADHIGCYGYPRDTTPNIDRLVRESVVFRQHFSQHVTTKPSAGSLFTSQYSDTHLAYGNRQLLEGTFTLAKGLEAAGFRTVLFSSNPNASPATGIGVDFQETHDQTEVKPLVAGWQELTSPAALLTVIASWLKKHGHRRFFAYVHFDPPHQPYLQPQEMTRLFAGQRPPNFRPGDFAFPVDDRRMLATCWHPPLPEWINLYDANLRYADWAVGELEKLLRQARVLDNTLFIVTSDHGEAFGEHGYLWHERGVYDELVHIPLLIRLPGGLRPIGSVDALTEAIDLLPTVCDLFEIPYPKEEVQGRSLLPLLAGLRKNAHPYVFSRSDGKPPCYLVRSQCWSLLLWGNGKWRALYDLKADPGQRKNVITQRPEVAKEMLEAFREFALAQRRPPLDFLRPDVKLTPLPEAGEVKLTPEVRRELRALGYLD